MDSSKTAEAGIDSAQYMLFENKSKLHLKQELQDLPN